MNRFNGFYRFACVCGCSALFCLPVESQPTDFTSFKPGTVWPADDGIHIDCHGGNIIYRAPLMTYYWYGEHRGTPRGVSCYSSSDLYNWKKEGVVLEKGTIPVLERPKVAYNETTKKYVMWFHYENSNYSLAHLGVAVSDSAKGPFTFITHFRPNGHQSRDIGMYTDDNGKVYIIYAADSVNVTIRMVELTADYLNVTTNDVDIQAHCEGPGLLKKNGVYYLITSQCSGWTPNQATWYTATNVMGPYTNKGNPCIGDVNNNTFNSQPCFIFKVPGYCDGFMYMGDRWNGSGSTNSQYVFLPITITSGGAMELRWLADWMLSVFDTNPIPIAAATATSQHAGNEAARAIDGSLSTFWHSEWSPMAALPQSITLDLGSTCPVLSLRYTPRQDGSLNGTSTGYTIAVSTNGTAFTQCASGTWADDATVKDASWGSANARYVRLTVTAGHGGYASAAEVSVLQKCTPTTEIAPEPVAPLLSLLSKRQAVFSVGNASFTIPNTVRGDRFEIALYDLSGTRIKKSCSAKRTFSIRKDFGMVEGVYIVRVKGIF